MKRPIYRKWFNEDITHFWKIYPDPTQPVLGISYKDKRIRVRDEVEIKFHLMTHLNVAKMAKKISKKEFNKAYEVALKKIQWMNKQTNIF